MDENTSSNATADDSQAVDTTNATPSHDAALLAEDGEEADAVDTSKEAATDSDEEAESEDAESESEEQEVAKPTDDQKDDDQSSEEDQTPTDDPKEIARRAYKQREEARQSDAQRLKAQNDQLSQYVNEAETPEQQAMRQLQVESYQTRIQSNTDKLVNSYEKAVSQIPEFQNPTPEVKRILDKAIDNFQAANVQIDANGNPYDVRADLYQYLQQEAEDIRALTQNGARKEGQNRAKSRSNAMTPPARQKPAPKVDPVMAELLKVDE